MLCYYWLSEASQVEVLSRSIKHKSFMRNMINIGTNVLEGRRMSKSGILVLVSLILFASLLMVFTMV